jgi:hypothetical protein
MEKITLNFGQNSAIAKNFRDYPEEFKKLTGREFMGGALVIEFVHTGKTPRENPVLLGNAILNRSSRWAETVIEESIKLLNEGKVIPEVPAWQLAQALERVLRNHDATNFIYGPQESVGRPPTDMFEKLYIFQVVEEQRARLGYLADSRKGDGAYTMTKRILNAQGVYKEVDEIRRIRNSVKKRAHEDLMYAVTLMRFLEDAGYDHKLVP